LVINATLMAQLQPENLAGYACHLLLKQHGRIYPIQFLAMMAISVPTRIDAMGLVAVVARRLPVRMIRKSAVQIELAMEVPNALSATLAQKHPAMMMTFVPIPINVTGLGHVVALRLRAMMI